MTMDIPEILTWSETLSCYGMSQTGMHLMPFQKNPGSGYKVLCGSVHPEKSHLSKLAPSPSGKSFRDVIKRMNY